MRVIVDLIIPFLWLKHVRCNLNVCPDLISGLPKANSTYC